MADSNCGRDSTARGAFMNCRTITTSLLAAVAVLVIFSQPALALPETHIAFDPSDQTVKVGISGGDAITYTIEVIPSGCVDTVAGTIDLIGPDDSGSVSLVCVGEDTNGKAQAAYCVGENCFDTKQVILVCRADCDLLEAGQLPALNKWSMLVLALVIPKKTIADTVV
jgi:hypothetical protein